MGSINESVQEAAERAVGGKVEYLESTWVVEKVDGHIVWGGPVSSFRPLKAPPMTVFAWAVQNAKNPGQIEYLAVLGTGPIDSPLAAVQAWLASWARQNQRPTWFSG